MSNDITNFCIYCNFLRKILKKLLKSSSKYNIIYRNNNIINMGAKMADIFDLFKQIEKKSETANTSKNYEFLLVGLGNPGKEYETTRHNAGFMCVDKLAGIYKFSVKNAKFKALVTDADINGHKCLVMKPQTFMNNSGEAVKAAADFYKIPSENIVVIYDDISLDVGKIRIRKSGSAGGHNGMKSLIKYLASDKFPRLRIGVGQKPHPEYDLAAWVTGNIPKEDMPAFEIALQKTCEAIPYVLNGEFDAAMCKFN